MDNTKPHQGLLMENGSYKVSAYAKRVPAKLEKYVRTHLPGWEVDGIETFHHHPVVIYKKIGTEIRTVSMKGSLSPGKLKNWAKGDFYHNWLRNGWNELSGPSGRYQQFLLKLTEKYGPIGLWTAHSASGLELWKMSPDADMFLVNPQPPTNGIFNRLFNSHTPKARYNDRTYAVRDSDDFLTRNFTHCNDQIPRKGPGGHPPMGLEKSIGGIWPEDTWEMTFPRRFSQIQIQEGSDGPVALLLKSEVPQSQYKNEGELFKATRKRITQEYYQEFKSKAKETSSKKEFKEVWKESKNHPRDKATRYGFQKDAQIDVHDDSIYQRELLLLNETIAVNKGVAAGKIKLVDKLVPKQIAVGSRYSSSLRLTNKVVDTAVSYGVSDAFVSGAVQLAVGLYHREEDESIEKIIAQAISDGAKSGFYTGLVAATGKVIENGVKLAGYGCRAAVPATLAVWSLTKTIYDAVTSPTAQTIYLSIGHYLKYLVPIKRRSYNDISGISGEILREHAQRVMAGKVERGREDEDIAQLVKRAFNR